MLDARGRRIDYLRVSVTDRCNLRCVYCMPEEGVAPVSHADILSFEEIVRVCRSAAALGVRRIRLTGGEPLVRKGIAELIRAIKAIDGIETVSITTNGILFGAMADELADAGLSTVNVSLDTLDPCSYTQITRHGNYNKAMEAIEKALAHGMAVRVNCVAAQEFGLEQALEVAKLARERPIDVRYIEIMPIGMGGGFTAISGDTLCQELEKTYGRMIPCAGEGGGPARYGRLPDFVGRIGFINAVSDRFCDDCNRVRLTAEGFLKLCLHYDVGLDLREPLRNGIHDMELTTLLQQAIYQKPAGHQFGAGEFFHQEMHKMVQIGG